jgi:DNA-binding ferritin-like protein
MFERFYEGLTEEVDTLAEKLVGSGQEQNVVSPARLAEVALILQVWSVEECPFRRSVLAERALQRGVRDVLENTSLSVGEEDFLGGLANAHETNLYLLQRRLSR